MARTTATATTTTTTQTATGSDGKRQVKSSTCSADLSIDSWSNKQHLTNGAVAAPVAGCRLPPLEWHGARVKRLECVSMGLDDENEDDDEVDDEVEDRGD
ncbi:hypothetical protein ACLKA7_015330 [Drosophila subpalustris]